jgi:glutathione S-transferase
MVLYTCKAGRSDIPGPFDFHPCAKAMKALDKAGIAYEHRTVDGLRILPWTTKSETRDEIRALTGQSLAPCLVLQDGTAIAGSGEIADWAKAHAVVTA